MSDTKYAVLRREDWEAIRTAGNVDIFPDDFYNNAELSDCAVLRLKDITAAPILHTYASMIVSFIDLLSSRGQISEHDRYALQDIADWAHAQAVKSEHMLRSLPD